MPNQIPVKYEGGKFKQFSEAEANSVPVKYGGTGATSFPGKGFILGEEGQPLRSVRCVYNGKVDPTRNEDVVDGFEPGSRWINTVNETEWVCIKNTWKNAIWIQAGDGDGDTFRYWGSLVDFEYDQQEYSWLAAESTPYGRNVVQVVYEYQGDHVGTMTMTYNDENQPTEVKMTYADSSEKIISLDYTDDGYLDTSVRA